MGAEKPIIPQEEAKKSISPIHFILGLITIGVSLYYIVSKALPYIDPKLSPREEKKLQKRLREIDDSEQYALIAKGDGWYPCLHSGRTSYYLKKGEVWKYGVTSKGETGRYKASFLIENRVFYFIQFAGTFSECLKQEQIKIFLYPHLPENLARPPAERLTRPPYNSIRR